MKVITKFGTYDRIVLIFISRFVFINKFATLKLCCSRSGTSISITSCPESASLSSKISKARLIEGHVPQIASVFLKSPILKESDFKVSLYICSLK